MVSLLYSVYFLRYIFEWRQKILVQRLFWNWIKSRHLIKSWSTQIDPLKILCLFGATIITWRERSVNFRPHPRCIALSESKNELTATAIVQHTFLRDWNSEATRTASSILAEVSTCEIMLSKVSTIELRVYNYDFSQWITHCNIIAVTYKLHQLNQSLQLLMSGQMFFGFFRRGNSDFFDIRCFKYLSHVMYESITSQAGEFYLLLTTLMYLTNLPKVISRTRFVAIAISFFNPINDFLASLMTSMTSSTAGTIDRSLRVAKSSFVVRTPPCSTKTSKSVLRTVSTTSTISCLHGWISGPENIRSLDF